MSDWKTLSSEIVYETPWIKIRRDAVQNQNGKPLTYSYMELKNPSVFVVAMNAAGEILIQNVYRYTINKRLWEIPAGHMEDNEEPLVAAKRELLEETNLESNDWHHLGSTYQIVGTGNVPMEVFLAAHVTGSQKVIDEDEDIEQHRFVSLEDLETMIHEGELVDSPVIGALYMTKIHLALRRNH